MREFHDAGEREPYLVPDTTNGFYFSFGQPDLALGSTVSGGLHLDLSSMTLDFVNDDSDCNVWVSQGRVVFLGTNGMGWAGLTNRHRMVFTLLLGFFFQNNQIPQTILLVSQGFETILVSSKSSAENSILL